MSSESLYERVLREIEAGAPPPKLKPPRASAAVVLWRRWRGELEVFWIRRSETVRFMGGFHAFPGGSLSRGDAAVEVAGAPLGVATSPSQAAMPPAVLDDIDDLGPVLIDGLVACALRELYEETGILPLEGASSPVRKPPRPDRRLAEGRLRLLEGTTDFGSLIGELESRPHAGDLVYAARWLTPPIGALRFDNRFFLLEWPADRRTQPQVVAGEAVAGEWVRPGEALDRWRSGEIITAPPILHILSVLAEDGPERGLARLRWPDEMNIGPYRRIEFCPGVLMFPVRTPTLPPAGFTNAYVLGTSEAVLVDPGSPYEGEIERLRQAMRALAATGRRQVRAIWLTHHHPDHVGGVAALRETLAVPVCAHAATADRLRQRGLEVDRELVDGERVELAGEPPFPVRILHTPGHARGHLCFFDETHGSLLAGDLVAGLGTIVIDPPEGDMRQYLASLERMRELGPRTLFPAHGPPVRHAAAKLDEYLRHRGWREQRILDVWTAGRRDTEAMLAAVYDDIPALARPLARSQIEAHLEHLRQTGKLPE